MLLIRFAGTAGSEVLTRRCLPLASTVTSEVWNVFSTCAALPSASMKARLAGTPVIFRPWDASHDDTVSTEAWVGEKRARYWSGVRYWRYCALPGVDTACASASAPAWSRRRSCTWKRTRVLRATAGLLAANRAEGRVLPLNRTIDGAAPAEPSPPTTTRGTARAETPNAISDRRTIAVLPGPTTRLRWRT